MIEITCNDRLGKKVRVKCNPDDTIADLKKLIAAQTGTRWDKIVLKKWYTTFKDHIQLQDFKFSQPLNNPNLGKAVKELAVPGDFKIGEKNRLNFSMT
ncbi:hypothetical protein ILUMI_10188 [Ignelater luminosus]|uniref:Ubiquitin-like protein 5 n=1 Tax=Ignelater luminosus TaxID=2038154 RepID=A0A8K0CYC5_IGNLU|nr:hypothetical protein ILUMI_10188 [Ignelater luminosus]